MPDVPQDAVTLVMVSLKKVLTKFSQDGHYAQAKPRGLLYAKVYGFNCLVLPPHSSQLNPM